jgi:hypothetical protein
MRSWTLYSSWHGGDGEMQAVFVIEAACVDCLKSALHTVRTFGIKFIHAAEFKWGTNYYSLFP